MAHPHTKTFKGQLECGCSCGGAYIWLKCEVRAIWFTAKQDGILYSVWEHQGSHVSNPCPSGGQLSFSQVQAVNEQVI
jgi:hypothetical protein